MARIYQTERMGEATLRVALVPRDSAELLVQRVASWGVAHGDAFWYVTRERQDASSIVFFCSPQLAQLKVCFVHHQSEAGWKIPKPRDIRL